MSGRRWVMVEIVEMPSTRFQNDRQPGPSLRTEFLDKIGSFSDQTDKRAKHLRALTLLCTTDTHSRGSLPVLSLMYQVPDVMTIYIRPPAE